MGERCGWCGTDPGYVAYHDQEWGVPERDPRALFEKLVLDGFQAGLSWLTILRKRPAFRAAFGGFDPLLIAAWGEPEVQRLLADERIVRHRGKIEATIANARAWLALAEGPGFSNFIWDHVDGVPRQHRFTDLAQVPATSALGDNLSRNLRGAGFRFCGPTISHAFAQAVGLVNDHLVGCPAHARCAALA